MRGQQIAILSDPVFREHQPGGKHPERPERLHVLEDLLHTWSGPGFAQVAPRLATSGEILQVHGTSHLERILSTAGLPRTQLDPDTATSARSAEVALLAAGGILNLVDMVEARAAPAGFALVRPPGHHATAAQAMGFCLFNNVAVAARHLRLHRGVERVAIVDFDLHHGNGTEAIFWGDDSVLYLSLHQYPWYPGTGAAGDLGAGAGEGFTVNLPFAAGAGDALYALAFDEIVAPVLRRYQPGFILVSAGFDAHKLDPLGALELTETGFRRMVRSLLNVAAEVCDGRLAVVLEGGYNLDALRGSTAAVLEELQSGPRPLEPAATRPSTEFQVMRRQLAPWWSL